MSDNILNDFLGLDVVSLKQFSEQNEEKRKEIAITVTRLTEYPEWKVFEDELERMLQNIDKPCEFYSQTPSRAHYDSGMKRSVKIIQEFIKTQKLLVEKYGKENSKENKES